MTSQPHDSDATRITTHIGGVDHLLACAGRSASRTDLVLTPEQLHARNLKQRLAATSQPRSSLHFRGLSRVAADLVESVGNSPAALDRVDRIRALEGLLDTRRDEFVCVEPLVGSQLPSHASEVESIRATVDAVTGFDADQLAGLRRLVASTPPAARRDAQDYVATAETAERVLAETSDVAVSSDAVLREATRLLRAEGTTPFVAAYPDVKRVHLAGVSSIDASLRAFLSALAEETGVSVHLCLRRGTGPRIAGRLRGESVDPWADTAAPTVSLGVPVTEMVASTRSQEARLALATVTGLLDQGVSPSDVLMIARDVDVYERVLTRAANHYGQPLSMWTQLSVTDTLPYVLVEAVCELLDARGQRGGVTFETLSAPLFAEWVQPGGRDVDDDWTPPLRAFDAAHTTLQSSGPQPLAAWRETVADAGLPDDVARWLDSLLAWATEQPTDPAPREVQQTVAPLLEQYRRVVLPQHRARDSAALAATTETARALVRLETLVDDVERKYAEWLDRGQAARTWDEVGYLFETIATVTPGRREHANAAVVDVVDATDAWARNAPYVVALGVVDGEWPQPPEGLLPVEVRDTLLAGETPTSRDLSPREGWTTAREFDHFVDAVSTATEHLVCTRYERTTDGSAVRRSPFLDVLDPDPTRVGEAATARLSSDERRLPDALSTVNGGGRQ